MVNCTIPPNWGDESTQTLSVISLMMGEAYWGSLGNKTVSGMDSDAKKKGGELPLHPDLD